MALVRAATETTTITGELVGLARTRPGNAALIGAPGHAGSPLRPLMYPDLAVTVRLAAAGLAGHGLRQGDVVGVLVDDAAGFTLAVHAIRAAGGIASPMPAGTPPEGLAAQLADCGARMLLTAPGLAETALAAADRSWVRQVISFGDPPGTIPFGSLLRRGSARPALARPQDLALLPYARTADGKLHPVAFTHADLAGELGRLAGTGLTERDVVIAVPPAGDGRAYTVLLDLALIHGATVVAATAEDTLADVAKAHGGTAAIMPPGTSQPASLVLRTLNPTTPGDGSRMAC